MQYIYIYIYIYHESETSNSQSKIQKVSDIRDWQSRKYLLGIANRRFDKTGSHAPLHCTALHCTALANTHSSIRIRSQLILPKPLFSLYRAGRSPKQFLFVFAFLSPCLAIIICYARWVCWASIYILHRRSLQPSFSFSKNIFFLENLFLNCSQ